MAEHNLLGERGESAAVRYLESRGCKILMRNFRAIGGEIDIVAQDGDTTVFVEVKTRSYRPSAGYGRASSAVDSAKLARIRKAILEYQRTYPESRKCRIEVAEVYFLDGKYEIKTIRL